MKILSVLLYKRLCGFYLYMQPYGALLLRYREEQFIII